MLLIVDNRDLVTPHKIQPPTSSKIITAVVIPPLKELQEAQLLLVFDHQGNNVAIGHHYSLYLIISRHGRLYLLCSLHHRSGKWGETWSRVKT